MSRRRSPWLHFGCYAGMMLGAWVLLDDPSWAKAGAWLLALTCAFLKGYMDGEE